MKVTVTQIAQTVNAEPYTMNYITHTEDPMDVMVAVAQLMAAAQPRNPWDPKVLSINVEL